MMNWKNVLVIGAFSILPVSMMGQANILNAKTPEEIGKKTEAQKAADNDAPLAYGYVCLLYTSPSPRDQRGSRMPSSA